MEIEIDKVRDIIRKTPVNFFYYNKLMLDYILTELDKLEAEEVKKPSPKED